MPGLQGPLGYGDCPCHPNDGFYACAGDAVYGPCDWEEGCGGVCRITDDCTSPEGCCGLELPEPEHEETEA